MGFKKSWDTDAICIQLSRMASECRSHYNDGFTAFEVKKDLLKVKHCLEDLLEICPTFSGEDELLHERLLTKLKK
jgi:hypothetical protein